MKKATLLLALVLVMASFFGCGAQSSSTPAPAESGAAQETELTRVGFVTNQAVDAAEFLQNLVAGLEAYDQENESVEIKVVEALEVDEIEPKIDALCQEGYDIVMTAYDTMGQATVNSAEKYPDIMFGIFDGAIENIEDYSNLQQFRLDRLDSGFIQGCVAGLMTEENKVGIVGGSDIGAINEIIAGWQQGIQYVNPDCEDVVTYCNSFVDPAIGKEYGLQLIAAGCDVVGAAAGGSGVGTAQAAEENDVMFAAWDVHYPEAAPTMELGSAVNFFDVAFLHFMEEAINGNFEGGINVEYGMDTGAAGYSFADNELVPDEVKAEIDTIIEKVNSGEITIDREMLHK